MSSSQKKSSIHGTVLRELVIPYWTRSEDKKAAWGLLVLALALAGAMVYSLVLLNQWNQGFFDALQKLDQAAFVRELWRFFFIALGYALIVAYKFYVLQSLAVRWRQWITKQNLEKWLAHKNYYFWQVTPNVTDNPDQRLSEDIHELTELSTEIGEKVIRELITFVSFIGILWGLSGSLRFSFLGYHVEVYRYLVWACLLYAVIGTWIAHKVGFPLSRLNFMQQKLEADFRYLLVRLRDNGEGVALSRGEKFENKKLSEKFRQVVDNFKALIRRQKTLLLTKNAYSQFAYIFPFVMASPQVFTKEISLGQLFQISSAFGQLQGSVSVFVEMYDKIMRLNSVIVRLGGFLLSLQEMEERPKTLVTSSSTDLQVRDLCIQTPYGQSLFTKLDFTLKKGERLLVTAPSGHGKSTLLRSLNQLWPYASGNLGLPAEKNIFVLPQKPYLPVGLFKEVLSYPDNAEKFNEETLRKALDLTKLSHLKKLMNEEDNWSLRLSVGEQQRLCFARLFVHQPAMAFLDESTSAIESDVEAELYRTLLERLPQITLITLSHDSANLASFHHKVLNL
jgi:putative ATP-binding cassette transporter